MFKGLKIYQKCLSGLAPPWSPLDLGLFCGGKEGKEERGIEKEGEGRGRKTCTDPRPAMPCHCTNQNVQNSLKVASSTPVQPHETLSHPTFMILLIRVHSENDSRVYFLIVLTTDYCWRSSWTSRIAAPFKSCVD